MPKSRPRRKPPVRSAQPPSAEEARQRRLREERRRRLGWPIAILGLALFLIGQVGSRTGLVILPFDPHHAISQIGGFFLAIAGLIWAWR